MSTWREIHDGQEKPTVAAGGTAWRKATFLPDALVLLRKVRGKWGLAPWRELMPRQEKRCRHGACPLFPQWWSKKGTGTVAGDRFITPRVNEATEPVPAPILDSGGGALV